MLNEEQKKRAELDLLQEINKRYKCVGESSWNKIIYYSETHFHKHYEIMYIDKGEPSEEVLEKLKKSLLEQIERDYPGSNCYVHRSGPHIDHYEASWVGVINIGDVPKKYSLAFRASFGEDWGDKFLVTCPNMIGLTDRVKALEDKGKVNA